MTLNGVMAVILRYPTEFGSLGANYVTFVEIEPMLSAAKKCRIYTFRQHIIYDDILREN